MAFTPKTHENSWIDDGGGGPVAENAWQFKKGQPINGWLFYIAKITFIVQLILLKDDHQTSERIFLLCNPTLKNSLCIR